MTVLTSDEGGHNGPPHGEAGGSSQTFERGALHWNSRRGLWGELKHPEPDDDVNAGFLSQLEAMGFSNAQAQAALVASEGDASLALELLLSGAD